MTGEDCFCQPDYHGKSKYGICRMCGDDDCNGYCGRWTSTSWILPALEHSTVQPSMIDFGLAVAVRFSCYSEGPGIAALHVTMIWKLL